MIKIHFFKFSEAYKMYDTANSSNPKCYLHIIDKAYSKTQCASAIEPKMLTNFMSAKIQKKKKKSISFII